MFEWTRNYIRLMKRQSSFALNETIPYCICEHRKKKQRSSLRVLLIFCTLWSIWSVWEFSICTWLKFHFMRPQSILRHKLSWHERADAQAEVSYVVKLLLSLHRFNMKTTIPCAPVWFFEAWVSNGTQNTYHKKKYGLHVLQQE